MFLCAAVKNCANASGQGRIDLQSSKATASPACEAKMPRDLSPANRHCDVKRLGFFCCSGYLFRASMLLYLRCLRINEDLRDEAMKKPPTRIMIDEASRQATRERPEAKQALDSLAKLIVESFVKSIPQDMTAGLARRLKTKAGKKEFAESWPIIVEAYFHALCNPKKR
jgi:hypothetical protein